MLIKNIFLIFILVCCCGIVSAGEIITEDHGTVFIYGSVNQDVIMNGINNEKFDYNKTVCVNSTVIEGEINIISSDNYELEYSFITDLNESDYITRIVIIKQEIISSSWLTGVKLNRSVSIDGITKASYTTTHSRIFSMTHNTFYWDLMESECRFGEEIINNESLAFTQLNYKDQQNFIPTQTLVANPQVTHKYISVGSGSFYGDGLRLTGLTGVIYNALGWIPKLGDSIQSLVFMPLAIVQYTFDFIFTFLFLIINNWWYALMLLEIMCIMSALMHTSYPSIISAFIEAHVKIFIFLYENVILNAVGLILRIIEIVRNIFRI